MFKKQNLKIIFLTMVFMFCITGSVLAANFSDLNGTADQTAAVYKLNALKIIDGYPDGTFGPDKTITRAEFAKIAVNMAGLQSVASGMANTESVFQDINTGDWYNGFVNVAAAQGYVKGDPSGNFRPNDQVTQGEVITVLMRLLGYNDNLSGDWPADYIGKAANLEIIEGVSITAFKPATRVDVASMGSKTLDQYMVEYQADSNTFANKLKVDKDDLDMDGNKTEEITCTLQEDKFKGSLTEDALVARFVVPDSENGQYKLDYYITENNEWTRKTVNLAKEFVVANGMLLTTPCKFVDFIVDDDDDAVYIDVIDYGKMHCDEIKCRDFDANGLARKVEIDNKVYDFAPHVYWSPACNGLPLLQMSPEKSEDGYAITFNDDGEIAAVSVDGEPAPGIVESVNAERKSLSLKTNPQPCLVGLGTSFGNKVGDLANKSFFVIRNGMPATLADLQPGDIVWVMVGQDDFNLGGYAGVDNLIVAFAPQMLEVKGKLTSVEANADGSLKKVMVNDKTYEVHGMTDYSAGRDLLTAGVSLADPGPDGYSARITELIMARIPELMAEGKTLEEAQALATAQYSPRKLQPMVSTDGGETFEEIASANYISGDNYNLLDQDVTLIMNMSGKVGIIISDVEKVDTGRIFGSIISIVPDTTKDSELVDMIKIVNKDDEEVSYAIDEDTTYNGEEGLDVCSLLSRGDLVGITLNGDGNIDNIKTNDIKRDSVNDPDDVDDDLDSIKIGGRWYSAGKVVVFNYKSADQDADIMNWDDIQDTIKSGAALDFDYYVKDNEIKYIGLKDQDLSTDCNYAVIVKNGKDSEDPYAVIIKGNQEQKYYLNNTASYEEIKKYKKGNLLAFKWEGDKLRIVPKSTLLIQIIGGACKQVTDVKVQDNIIELDEVAYLVDEDTVVYDSTDHDNLQQLTLSDIARGDSVYAVYDQDQKVLAAIVITDADDARDMGIGAQ